MNLNASISRESKFNRDFTNNIKSFKSLIDKLIAHSLSYYYDKRQAATKSYANFKAGIL